MIAESKLFAIIKTLFTHDTMQSSRRPEEIIRSIVAGSKPYKLLLYTVGIHHTVRRNKVLLRCDNGKLERAYCRSMVIRLRPNDMGTRVSYHFRFSVFLTRVLAAVQFLLLLLETASSRDLTVLLALKCLVDTILIVVVWSILNFRLFYKKMGDEQKLIEFLHQCLGKTCEPDEIP